MFIKKNEAIYLLFGSKNMIFQLQSTIIIAIHKVCRSLIFFPCIELTIFDRNTMFIVEIPKIWAKTGDKIALFWILATINITLTDNFKLQKQKRNYFSSLYLGLRFYIFFFCFDGFDIGFLGLFCFSFGCFGFLHFKQ